MTDESLLDGLDPFDLLDRESERVHSHFASGPDWDRPSRCAGWTTRDMLGHLTGLEDYVAANLDGRVRALFEKGRAAGAHGIDGFNAWQVAAYAAVPTDELIERWHAANLAGRTALRARGRHGVVDTSIGEYPSWLQTFHFAVEYATHGDDIGVYVDPNEATERIRWRAAFGAFVLQELEKPVRVSAVGEGSVLVAHGSDQIMLAEGDFVEVTQGRLADGHPLPAEWRARLVTVP